MMMQMQKRGWEKKTRKKSTNLKRIRYSKSHRTIVREKGEEKKEKYENGIPRARKRGGHKMFVLRGQGRAGRKGKEGKTNKIGQGRTRRSGISEFSGINAEETCEKARKRRTKTNAGLGPKREGKGSGRVV